MQFRTEIEPIRKAAPIDHSQRLMLLGSCFTDNIGSRLQRDGFNASVNPMGALYNPLSIANAILRALSGQPFTQADLTADAAGVWHCLDFESRRQNADIAVLLESLNADFAKFADDLKKADVWIVTFGTAWVFDYLPTGETVGNCHKFPSTDFSRRRLSVEEITRALQPLINGRRVIFTVSPIRHLADGLHGNNLSKATLLLATEKLGEYFPAFEIVNDDLRDYRFYAADLKHPSETAADYIYEIFSNTYFSAATRQLCLEHRRQSARAAHKPIIG